MVAECNRLGIVVDCAHASFAATMAVLEVSSRPVIISHGQLGRAGTDLDGNYRPVLTSYPQLADLTGLLRDRGLPADRVQQVLGGNAADLLRRAIP